MKYRIRHQLLQLSYKYQTLNCVNVLDRGHEAGVSFNTWYIPSKLLTDAVLVQGGVLVVTSDLQENVITHQEYCVVDFKWIQTL